MDGARQLTLIKLPPQHKLIFAQLATHLNDYLARNDCYHDFTQTARFLADVCDDVEPILQQFIKQQAYCDCEALNVLKAAAKEAD